MQAVITVENISKQYAIGRKQEESFPTLRDEIGSFFGRAKGLFNRTPHQLPGSPEEFWALKDVSFQVSQGDRIGIIGRNGAGKSTLLKILSRITEPTSGRIRLRGRVASLLEVGTGFHPELTGRENIFLNGSVLGMAREDIRKKFDEIVAFAEVDQFLDTPVKRYSSGMYVRLAFAVAAHLEPEILVVDEVLAVGDAQFQKKCLGKMEEVSTQEGRTVLFVSHNMQAVAQLCTQGILLSSGRISVEGDVGTVIEAYLGGNDENRSPVINLQNYPQRRGNMKAYFDSAEIRDRRGTTTRQFHIGDDISMCLALRSMPTLHHGTVVAGIEIRTSTGQLVCNILNSDSQFPINLRDGASQLMVTISDVRLYPDTYRISLKLHSENSMEIYDFVEDCLSFDILDGGNLVTRNLTKGSGLFLLTPQWRTVGFRADLQ